MDSSSARASNVQDFYCIHCKKFVSKATFYRHRSRYFINGRWITDNNELEDSDESVRDDDFSSRLRSIACMGDLDVVGTPIETAEPMEELSVQNDDIFPMNGIQMGCMQ